MARIGLDADGNRWILNPETGQWEVTDQETFEQARRQIDLQRENETAVRRQRAAEMAAEGVGPFEAARIGAGKTFYDIGTGLKDLYLRAFGQQEQRQALEAEQAQRETAYSALRRARPFATSIGESVPYVAAGGIAGVGPNIWTALLRQGLAGGAVGAAQYDPTIGGRAWRSGTEALLGAGGEGLGRGLGRMVAPHLPARGGDIQRVAQEGEAIGMQTNPYALIEGKSARQTFEGSLESMPTSAPLMNARQAANEAVLAREAARSIGETTEELTGEVLSNAANRIGSVFDDVIGAHRSFNLIGAPLARLKRIYNTRIKKVVGQIDPVGDLIDRITNTLATENKGIISGQQLYGAIKQIRETGRSLMKNPGTTDIGKSHLEAHDALLKAVMSQVSPVDAERFKIARSQWRNYSNILKAVDPVEGTVSPKKLNNVLEKADKRYFTGEDRNPFYTAVRYLSKVQPELPTSGTSERSFLMRHLGEIQSGLAAGGGVGSFVSSGDPISSIGLAALPYAVPYAMARGYLNPRARNWLLRAPPESRAVPLQPTGRFAFAGQPIPGTPDIAPFQLTQQGLLGMTGIGGLHGYVGMHRE